MRLCVRFYAVQIYTLETTSLRIRRSATVSAITRMSTRLRQDAVIGCQAAPAARTLESTNVFARLATTAADFKENAFVRISKTNDSEELDECTFLRRVYLVSYRIARDVGEAVNTELPSFFSLILVRFILSCAHAIVKIFFLS